MKIKKSVEQIFQSHLFYFSRTEDVCPSSVFDVVNLLEEAQTWRR